MNHEPLPSQGTADVNVMALVEQLANLAKRGHYYCEDPWYSCPKAEDGCANENAGGKCNCGTDEHNAEVDALSDTLLASLHHNKTYASGVGTDERREAVLAEMRKDMNE